METAEILFMIENHYEDICRGLYDLDLYGVNLREAYLHGAVFDGSWLTRADMRYANLMDANLRWCKMEQVDLTCANLRGANLSEADLRGANLSNADLRGANLRFADLRWVDFYEADLRGVDFRDALINQDDLYRFERQFRLADTRDVHIC